MKTEKKGERDVVQVKIGGFKSTCNKLVIWKMQGRWGFGAGRVLFYLKEVPFSPSTGMPAAHASHELRCD